MKKTPPPIRVWKNRDIITFFFLSIFLFFSLSLSLPFFLSLFLSFFLSFFLSLSLSLFLSLSLTLSLYFSHTHSLSLTIGAHIHFPLTILLLVLQRLPSQDPHTTLSPPSYGPLRPTPIFLMLDSLMFGDFLG